MFAGFEICEADILLGRRIAPFTVFSNLVAIDDIEVVAHIDTLEMEFEGALGIV